MLYFLLLFYNVEAVNIILASKCRTPPSHHILHSVMGKLGEQTSNERRHFTHLRTFQKWPISLQIRLRFASLRSNCLNSLHLGCISHQGFTLCLVRSVWLTVTTARAASSVHRPSKRLLQTPVLLPITTEVISSKRDCMLLNLLINVTTTI